MSNMFTSSIGKKFIMSLAGLFLIVFLVIHLAINLALVFSDSTEAFNKAATFMRTNKVIMVMEVVLFLGFLLHMIYGVILQIQNLLARPVRYKKNNHSRSRNFFTRLSIIIESHSESKLLFSLDLSYLLHALESSLGSPPFL